MDKKDATPRTLYPYEARRLGRWRFGGLAALTLLLALPLYIPSGLAGAPVPEDPLTCTTRDHSVSTMGLFLVQTPHGALVGQGKVLQDNRITRCTTFDTHCPAGWYEVQVHGTDLDVYDLASLDLRSDSAYHYGFDCTNESDARDRAERIQAFHGSGEGIVLGDLVSGHTGATGGHLQRMFTPYGFTFVDATKETTVTGIGFA